MTIPDFNNEYLTPMHAKILQEEKTCLLMPGFYINLRHRPQSFILLRHFVFKFFRSLHFTAKKVGKNL